MAKELAAHSVCVTEMRDVLHECNDHLEKIEKYTGILSGMDVSCRDRKNTKECDYGENAFINGKEYLEYMGCGIDGRALEAILTPSCEGLYRK